MKIQSLVNKKIKSKWGQARLSLISFFAVLSFIEVEYETSPFGNTPAAYASVSSEDSEKSRYESEIVQSLKSRVQSDLNKYCPDGCSILGIEAEAREVFDTSSASLGFETNVAAPRRFSVRRSLVEVLVDNRLGTSNIERIENVIERSSRNYGIAVEIEFIRTTLPDSPQLVRSESQARSLALDNVRSAYEKIVNDFCPEECRLNSVEISTSRMSVDEIQAQPARRIAVIPESKWALYIQGSTVNMSIDEQMPDQRREQIEELMRDSMEAYGAVALNVKKTLFPKSARQLEKDADEMRDDPWGLDKLGRALKVFREFANTKEIIRERESLSRETENKTESLAERRSETKESTDKSRESSQLQSQTENKVSDKESISSFWSQEKILLAAAVLAVLLIVAAVALRVVLTGKQVQHLISEGRGGISDGFSGSPDESQIDPSLIGVPPSTRSLPQAPSVAQVTTVRSPVHLAQGLTDELAQRLNTQSLKDELTQAFITQPKLAREVFARVLREDGVEFSAKCVAILGEMVVFDLVSDDDLKKEVALLAEYIHVSTPYVSESEQLTVLRNLKLKITAAKMRIMTQRTKEAFDFLRTQSAQQIYDLIVDESARSQAVVLTQLSTERRRMVFELFAGTLKNDLLRELCIKETLPREYLQNVADALKRKLRQTGVLDGESLGGADVLIDLMERSDRDGQSQMMSDLDVNNPELSRQVRSRLVSVESLAYLSDGLLLEIFLSLEPQTMVVFLAGVREHIRTMILNKAPDEVAADWSSSAASVRSIDPETFRLAEMQVIGKVRGFAANGMLNLFEINEIMFPIDRSGRENSSRTEAAHRVPVSNLVVA
ncbi:MAG: hypothetical protein FJY29_09085 [Betaproteobacteria bacterium]|nr:hypothetical protein [Betaproteobacteria bacterium]